MAARLPNGMATPEALGERRCRLRQPIADSLEYLGLRLSLVDAEFTVHHPSELIDHLAELGARLVRAASDG